MPTIIALSSLTVFSQTATKDTNVVVLPKRVAIQVVKDLIRADGLDSTNKILTNNNLLLSKNIALKDSIITKKDSIILIYAQKEVDWVNMVSYKNQNIVSYKTELTQKTSELKSKKRWNRIYKYSIAALLIFIFSTK